MKSLMQWSVAFLGAAAVWGCDDRSDNATIPPPPAQNTVPETPPLPGTPQATNPVVPGATSPGGLGTGGTTVNGSGSTVNPPPATLPSTQPAGSMTR